MHKIYAKMLHYDLIMLIDAYVKLFPCSIHLSVARTRICPLFVQYVERINKHMCNSFYATLFAVWFIGQSHLYGGIEFEQLISMMSTDWTGNYQTKWDIRVFRTSLRSRCFEDITQQQLGSMIETNADFVRLNQTDLGFRMDFIQCEGVNSFLLLRLIIQNAF